MQRQLLSLYDLLINVRRAIALNFDEPIWITAEIAQRSSSNGHAYLTLVEKESDDSNLRAQVSAVIWKTNLRPIRHKIQQSIGDLLAIGMEIAALVEVSYHQVYGIKLSIIDIDEQHTLGLLAKQRLETVARLKEANLLNLNAQLEAPVLWQRIAVISSSGAAGYSDFVQSMEHNAYGFKFDLTLFEAKVQGDQVRDTTIKALEAIAANQLLYDLVVVIRGGGSKLDLRGFDDYEVCAALASCPIPVLTGIGHETDQSVADMVAAYSVKTPTAAANFIIERTFGFFQEISQIKQRLTQLAERSLDQQMHDTQRLRDLILQHCQRSVGTAASALDHHQRIVRMAAKNLINNEQDQLQMIQHQIQLLDPLATLKRGFTITNRLDGLPLDPDELEVGHQLETRWAHKTIISTVS